MKCVKLTSTMFQKKRYVCSEVVILSAISTGLETTDNPRITFL